MLDFISYVGQHYNFKKQTSLLGDGTRNCPKILKNWIERLDNELFYEEDEVPTLIKYR